MRHDVRRIERFAVELARSGAVGQGDDAVVIQVGLAAQGQRGQRRGDAEGALAQAAAADARRAAGQAFGPLDGVPIAHKDIFVTQGLPTTAACPAFSYRPSHSATVVERLLVAHAPAVARLRQQVGRIRHGLHAGREDRIRAAGRDVEFPLQRLQGRKRGVDRLLNLGQRERPAHRSQATTDRWLSGRNRFGGRIGIACRRSARLTR